MDSPIKVILYLKDPFAAYRISVSWRGTKDQVSFSARPNIHTFSCFHCFCWRSSWTDCSFVVEKTFGLHILDLVLVCILRLVGLAGTSVGWSFCGELLGLTGKDSISVVRTRLYKRAFCCRWNGGNVTLRIWGCMRIRGGKRRRGRLSCKGKRIFIEDKISWDNYLSRARHCSLYD